MNGILNRYHKMGILLLCVMTLGLLAYFGGASGTLTASDGASYDIAVTYGAAARIPAGASLEVAELSGARYEGYYARAVAELGRVDSMRAFDIRCVAPDGTEIEPAAPVKVAFRFPGSGAAAARVLHFVDGGGVVSPSLKRGAGVLDFETDSFSVYAVVGTALQQTPLSVPLAFNERFADFTTNLFPGYLLSGPETAEAKIGETYYDTLADAVAAAQDGDSVELLRNVTGHFSTDKTITLDLGGHTFTVDADEGVQSTVGTLTITNGNITSGKESIISAKGGTIQLESSLRVDCSGAALYAYNGGSVVLDGAYVSSTSTAHPAAVVIGSASSIQVNSGTLYKTGSNHYTLNVRDGATATIHGGEVSNSVSSALLVYGNGSVVNINGGTLTGTNFHTVWLYAGGELNVSGGVITGNAGGIYVYDGAASRANISGGEIKNIAVLNGTAAITGGVFQQSLSSLQSYIVPGCHGYEEKGYTHVYGGLTITAGSGSKVYDGTELTNPDYTLVGELKPGDSIVEGSITMTGGRTDAGSNDNVPGGAVIKNASDEDVTANYTITYVNGTLTVTPAPVTVKADDKTKVQGADDPELTARVTGTLGEDTVSYTLSRVEGTDVGSYTITPAGDAVQGNYAVTYETGTLTIAKAIITVTADDKTKTYDEADPALTATVTELPEGETQPVITPTLSREAGETVGTYVITPAVEAVPEGYVVTCVPGTLTIEGIPVTVKADDKTKVYGAADPELTATVTGTLGDDTIAYTLSRAAGTDVGTYTITPAGDAVQLGKYAVTYETDTLTITKAAVIVKADDKTKVYGAADPELTATVTGTVGNDTISYTLSREAGTDVGEYTITPAGDAEQGNYTVTYEAGTLTITKAAVTVTADDQTKVYDTADPKLTATVEGLQNRDLPSVITYTCTRAAGTDVGEYTITPAGDEVQGNYTVTYAPGTLTIEGIPVTVKADDQTKVYDTADPELTATVTGTLGDDTIAYTLSRAAGTDVGTYTITPAGDAVQLGKYAVTYETGTLTITKAAVTVTADNQTKVYGTADPELTATVTSTVGNDTISYTLSREAGENVGTYAITFTGEAEQGNYTVTYVNGMFTITPATVTIAPGVTAADETQVYGQKVYGVADDPPLTATVTGLWGEDTISYTLSRDEGENAGNYAVNFQGDELQGNYTVVFTPGVFRITPKPVTVTITGNNDRKTYDGMEHSVTGYDVGISDSYTEAYFHFDGTAEAKRTDAGKTFMGLTAEQFINDNTNFDVTFEIEDGYQEIAKLEVTVTIDGNSGEFDYDGTEHVVRGYTASADSPLYKVGTPDDGTDNPGDGTDNPGDGSDNSGDGSGTPNDGSGTPSDGSGTPDGGTPDDGTGTLNDASGNSGDGTGNPGDDSDTPGDGSSNPGDGNGNFGDGSGNSGDGSGNSGDGSGNSGDGSGTPGDGSDNSGDGSGTPGDGSDNSGDGSGTPSDGSDNSGDGSGTPGDGSDTPGDGSGTPGDGSGNSGDGSGTPSDGSGTPGDGTGTPGDGSGTPGDGTGTPGDGSDNSGDGSGTPGDGTGTPNTLDRYFTFSGTAEAKRTDAGRTNMGLTAEQFQNINDNFQVTFFVRNDGYVTINPIDATVIITGHNDTVAYDGQEHSVSGYDVQSTDGSSLYTKTFMTFTGTAEAKGTDAGTYNMRLTEANFRNDSPNFNNVTFEVTDGFLTITPIAASVSITGHNKTVAYTGEEQSVEGYDLEFSTPLYTENDFEFIGSSDEARRIDAGTTYMNLSPEFFKNISLNFEPVTFDVKADGWITVNPAVVVRKELQDDLATEPETFTFRVSLKDDEGGGNHVPDYPLADDITTDGDGSATFALAVKGGEAQEKIFSIPLGYSITVEEDAASNVNNYTTWISADGDEYEDTVASLYSVTESRNEIVFTNVRGSVCRIEETAFQTISSAVAYAKAECGGTAVIEMLTDYTMSAADEAVIPPGCHITLATAPEYEGASTDGIATITRAPEHTGAMFANNGTLNLGGTESAPDSKIILDGNGANVAAAQAMILNSGTLNISGGATLQNARNGNNGGAIRSNGGTVKITGGTLTGSHAASGGALYATDNAAVEISGGTLTGNSADNGGALYATDNAAVEISGGTLTGNSAGNGGALYATSGATVQVTGGVLAGNSATSNGGALYVTSGVTVSGGLIGTQYTGETENPEDMPNRAANGAAIFVADNGTATFSGGNITGNVATDGGAVGINTINAKLNFTGSPKILGNRLSRTVGETTTEVDANIYLNQDSEHIITALAGLVNTAKQIGIYVPGEGQLYEHRGVSQARFGNYTSTEGEGVNAFRNDRTPGMQVQSEKSWLSWGKPLKVAVYYRSAFGSTPDQYPPRWKGTVKNKNDFYPANIQNFVSDIAADSALLDLAKALENNKDIKPEITFACAFAEKDRATNYNKCLSEVSWDNASGDWKAIRCDGTEVEGNVDKIIVYYSLPAYLSISNNTDYRLNISALTLNGIDAASNSYGFVVAQNGRTVEHFVPLKEDDLHLDSKQTIKLMFPGVRGQQYQLHGAFSEGATVNYTYDTANEGSTERVTRECVLPDEAGNAMESFTITGKTFTNNNDPDSPINGNSTIEIVFGGRTVICRIVDKAGQEHLYPSLVRAVEDALNNYNDYTVSVPDESGTPRTDENDNPVMDDETGLPVTDRNGSYDTVKIEMLRDYLILSTDRPDIPAGRNFTLTTAETYDSGNGDRRAKISRDQGNTNSFITVDETSETGQNVEGHTLNTALTVENLRFDGKQVGSSNGGVVHAKKCTVTIRNCEFTNFKAGDGGAIYVGVYTGDNCVLRIWDCVFENCRSTGEFPLRKGGGAIWTTAGYFELIRCRFTSCEAYDQGGAVFHRIDAINSTNNGSVVSTPYDYRQKSRTVVIGCTFEHCKGCAGGGLEIDSHHAVVWGTNFLDCQATKVKTYGRNGGAFNAYLQEIEDKNLSTPSETALSVKDCDFTNCFAAKNGGAFRTTYKNTTVTNCTFTNNTANEDGGGVSQTNGTGLVLDHCTVTGNKSGRQGGGVFANGHVTLRNDTTISGNSLTTSLAENGAGIYIKNGKKLTIGPKNKDDPHERDTITVNGNTSIDGSPSNLRLPSGDTENSTECVIVCCDLSEQSDLCVLNAKRTSTRFGKAQGLAAPANMNRIHGDNNDYGDSSLYGVIDRGYTDEQKIIWCGRIICKITDENGQLLHFANGDDAVFDHLDNNSGNADSNGAFSILKYKNDSKLYLNGTKYTGTFYIKMLVPKYTAERYIMTNADNASWQKIVLTTAGKDDTDGYRYEGENTRAEIIRSTKIAKTSSFMTVKVNLTLENITVEGAEDDEEPIPLTANGGLIMVDRDSASATLGENAILKNCVVKPNQKKDNTFEKRDGGGVYVQKGTFVINGGIIQNCRAMQAGDTGGNGGGVYMTGGSFEFRKGEIRNCSADINGGGVCVSSGTLTMSGGSIEGNTASVSGGGVFVADNQTMNMSGHVDEGDPSTTATAVRNNSAPTGGGIAVGGENATLNFSGDSVVYGNTNTNGAACNVELNYNTDAVINTSGLGADALIGVYVPGEDDTEPYQSRGDEGDLFGTRTGDDNLFLFVNDRNALRGWKHETQDKVVWMKMQSLTVSKTVSSPLNSDHRNVYFDFTVIVNSSINGNLGSGKTSMNFTNGVATFSLRDGESKTALYLPAMSGSLHGDYTVMETENSGFTTAVVNDGTEVPAGKQNITIAVNGVDKTGIGVTGTFSTASDAPSAHTVAFTNTRKTGNLTVEKIMDSDDSNDESKNFSFTVLLSNDKNDLISGTYEGMNFTGNKATFTLTPRQSVTAQGLPTGIRYTITESYSPNFNTVIKVNGTEVPSAVNVDLQPGENHVQFTNTRKKGGLIVKKAVKSDAAADKKIPFYFTVKLNDGTINKTYGEGEHAMTFVEGVAKFSLKHDEYKEAIGLPNGLTYVVTEEAVPGFINTRKSYNSGTIRDNVITSTFTNTRQTGKLTIYKKLVNDRYADRNTVFKFKVSLGKNDGGVFNVDKTLTKTYTGADFVNGVATVTIAGAGQKTISGLPQGIDYQVEEIEIPTNFTNPDTVQTGTIGAAGVSATFTNTRATGDLTVTKTVRDPLTGDETIPFTFRVQLADTKINGKTFEAVKTSGEGTENTTVTFNNSTASVELTHGQSITIRGLPTDVAYTVTETPNDKFKTTSTGASGTIRTTESVAAFTNTRQKGVLKVSKTVDKYIDALDKDVEFDFTVTLNDTSVGNTAEHPEGVQYGDMTFKDGVATFKLKHNQKLEAQNLPISVGYTVTEAPHDDFTTTSTGASGTISQSITSSAEFTNTRKSRNLTITKEVVSALTTDTNRTYDFTIQLGVLDGDGTFVQKPLGYVFNSSGVRFKNNGISDPFKIAPGAAKTISLPSGMAYKVIETQVDNMTTTVKDAGGTDVTQSGDGITYAVGAIARDADSALTFTNTRKTGTLTVSKTVNSSRARDDTKDFEFTVKPASGFTVINGVYRGVTFTDNVGRFTLKHDGTVTTTLPLGVDYTVTETTGGDFDTTIKGTGITEPVTGKSKTVSLSETQSTVTLEFTNKQSGITGVGFKKVDGSGNPVPDAVFKLYTDFECNPNHYEEGTEVTSDYSGNVRFGTLAYGDHYMKEEPLGGFKEEPDKKYLVRVGGDNLWEGKEYGIFLLDNAGQPQTTPDISKFGIMNISKETSPVILRKIGKDGDAVEPLASDALTQVKFDILCYDKTVFRYEEGGVLKPAKDLTPASNGVFWVGDLPHGQYYLHETSVPAGYDKISATNDNWFWFKVDGDGASDPKPLNAEPMEPILTEP